MKMTDLIDRKQLVETLGEMVLSALKYRGYAFQYPSLNKTTPEHALAYAHELLELARKEHAENKKGRNWMSRQIRDEVFQRDRGICHYCGDAEDPSIDHKIPVAKGGTDDIENLVVACFSCNVRKKTMGYEEFKRIAHLREPVGGSRPGSKPGRRGGTKIQRRNFGREETEALLACLGGPENPFE